MTREKHPTKGKYILDGHKVVECNDLFEWAEWFELNFNKRVVKTTEVVPEFIVSTIFLSIDNNFLGAGKPVLFETVITAFEVSRMADYIERGGETWEDAEVQHERGIQYIKDNLYDAQLNKIKPQ